MSPSSIDCGLHNLTNKSFFDEHGNEGATNLETISWQLNGKKLSQTASESAIDFTMEETREDLHTSWGDVNDKICAKQSWGKSSIFWKLGSLPNQKSQTQMYSCFTMNKFHIVIVYIAISQYSVGVGHAWSNPMNHIASMTTYFFDPEQICQHGARTWAHPRNQNHSLVNVHLTEGPGYVYILNFNGTSINISA